MTNELEIGRADAVAQVKVRANGLYVASASADGAVAVSRLMATPTSALLGALERLRESRPDVGRAFVEYAELGDDYDVNLVGAIVYAGEAV